VHQQFAAWRFQLPEPDIVLPVMSQPAYRKCFPSGKKWAHFVPRS
jgi:hypothetical protein